MVENIDDLQAFVESARSLSLTAASKVLQVTPAAVSAAIKRLEAQLGARLLERTTRSLRLTPHGEVYLGYVQRALALLAEGHAQITEDSHALAGPIRLATPSDLTRRLLWPWLDEFLQAHPRVSLSLLVSDRVHDLIRDEVDVALRYGPLADSRLVVIPLAQTHRVAAASPAYLAAHGVPEHPRQLAQHDCITFFLRGRRHVQWEFVDAAGARYVQRVDGRRCADDAELAQRWALDGRGIVYKSELDMRDALRSGTLQQILPQWRGESLPLSAILASNQFTPARVRALIAWLRERLQRMPAQ